MLGECHTETAIDLNNMGGVYCSLGDYKTALSYYLRALEIQKVTLGEKHSSTATTLINIGGVYSSLKEHVKAIDIY